MSFLGPDAGLAAATPVTFTDVLYDDGEVSLTLDERAADERLIVFFPHRHSIGLDPDGDPGRAFARKYGLNAAIIRVAERSWFQSRGVSRVWQILDRLRVRYPHLVFSGASMGGYGAIIAASVVPANHVFLFSPLATLDPSDPPGGPTFAADFARLGRLPLPDRHLADRYTVFVDRGFRDNRHLKMFGLPEDRTKVLGVTGVGHGVMDAIAAMGLLAPVTLAAMEPDFGQDLMDRLQPLLNQRKRETTLWVKEMFLSNLGPRPSVAAAIMQRAEAARVGDRWLLKMRRRLRRRLKDMAATPRAA